MWTAIRNKLLLGVLALGLMGPAAGAAVLQPFTATYSASHGFIGLGTATFELSRSGDKCWRWHGVADPSGVASLFVGKVTDESLFCVRDDGSLKPLYFAHTETGDLESSYSLDFNWFRGTVQYNNNEPFPVPQNAIDPFLIQIAARLWLARAEDPTSLAPRVFTVVDENEITHYRLAVSDGPQVETGAGTFDTIRVARVDEEDEKLILWVAPELAYLPVKVEHRENGDTQISLVLQSVDMHKTNTD